MVFEGKVALVTGAALGIGFEISKELLQQGVQGVLLADINETTGNDAAEKLKKQFGSNKVKFLKIDVTKDTEFENAFKKSVEIFGKLDILVNNAGILNDQNYNLEIDINFIGVVRGIKLGFKYLDKGGIILNIASSTAIELYQCFPIYSATKAAVVNLTRGFGHDFHFNKTGIKVIGLCPGKTETTLIVKENLLDGCFEELGRIVVGQNLQQTDAVARAATYAIKNGESGSVWLVDQNKLYKFDTPSWDSVLKPIMEKI